jgi:hypothetical protein
VSASSGEPAVAVVPYDAPQPVVERERRDGSGFLVAVVARVTHHVAVGDLAGRQLQPAKVVAQVAVQSQHSPVAFRIALGGKRAAPHAVDVHGVRRDAVDAVGEEVDLGRRLARRLVDRDVGVGEHQVAADEDSRAGGDAVVELRHDQPDAPPGILAADDRLAVVAAEDVGPGRAGARDGEGQANHRDRQTAVMGGA